MWNWRGTRRGDPELINTVNLKVEDSGEFVEFSVFVSGTAVKLLGEREAVL